MRTTRRESIWLDCSTPGCGSGTTADPRHLANLTASGGWVCPSCEACPGSTERAT